MPVLTVCASILTTAPMLPITTSWSSTWSTSRCDLPAYKRRICRKSPSPTWGSPTYPTLPPWTRGPSSGSRPTPAACVQLYLPLRALQPPTPKASLRPRPCTPSTSAQRRVLSSICVLARAQAQVASLVGLPSCSRTLLPWKLCLGPNLQFCRRPATPRLVWHQGHLDIPGFDQE